MRLVVPPLNIHKVVGFDFDPRCMMSVNSGGVWMMYCSEFADPCAMYTAIGYRRYDAVIDRAHILCTTCLIFRRALPGRMSWYVRRLRISNIRSVFSCVQRNA